MTKSLTAVRMDQLAADMIPVAARLTEAVADTDRDAIAELLLPLPTETLHALCVVLAAHVNVDLPMKIRHHASPTERVTELVCQTFGCTPEEILGSTRRVEVMEARKVVYYAAHLLGRSYAAIGRDLNGRDHSTVLHGAAQCGETPRLRRAAVLVAERLGWERLREEAAG